MISDKKRNLLSSMSFRGIILFLVVVFCAPFLWEDYVLCRVDDIRSWLLISCATLFAGIVLQGSALCYLQRYNRFLVSLDLLLTLVRLFFVAWSIYGNVIYYR